MKKLLCWLDIHDWRLEREVYYPGTGYTDSPMDFESGGVDWHLTCARCGQQTIERKRGVWVPNRYPPNT